MRPVRAFGLYIPIQLLLLAISEAFVFMGSVYGGAALRFWDSPDGADMHIGWLLPRAVLYAGTMVLSMAALGLYGSRQRGPMLATVVRVAICILAGGIVLAVCFYAFPGVYVGRGAFALAIVTSVLGIVALRALTFNYLNENVFKRRALVLGTGVKALSLLNMRRRSDWCRLSLVGFWDLPGELCSVDQRRVLTSNQTLTSFVIQNNIDQIIVALDDRRNHLPVRDLLECVSQGVEVVDINLFFEHEFAKLKSDFLDPSNLIFLEGFQQKTVYQHIKRALDIVISFLLLLFSWPIMLLAAFAILAESGWKGPVLYEQRRVSQGNKLFKLLKFRSMHVNAEKDQEPRWANAKDSRITRVGAFLRRFRIDELPQIFNILAGDMSLVGPRPERPEFVSELEKVIPLYSQRHRVKAGLSGWAQLRYPYGASERDALEKLHYDLYYVKNYCLMMDVLILMQTAEVVLFGKGAR